MENAQAAVPQLFENEFPAWFAGVAFAAIVIGALVPAAIMSIAAANLWTRNIYKAFIKPYATPKAEATQAKLISLLVKFGFPGTETKVYIALVAILANLLFAVGLTFVLRAMNIDPGVDQTHPDDYAADVGDEGVEEELDPHQPVHA